LSAAPRNGARDPRACFRCDLYRVVGGASVRDYDFVRKLELGDIGEKPSEPLGFIQRGDDDRETKGLFTHRPMSFNVQS